MVKERCLRNGKNEMKRIENRSDDADDGDDDVMATSDWRFQALPISCYRKSQLAGTSFRDYHGNTCGKTCFPSMNRANPFV